MQLKSRIDGHVNSFHRNKEITRKLSLKGSLMIKYRMSRALRFIRLFQLFCPGDFPVNLVFVGPGVDCNSVGGVMLLYQFLCSPISTSQGLGVRG